MEYNGTMDRISSKDSDPATLRNRPRSLSRWAVGLGLVSLMFLVSTPRLGAWLSKSQSPEPAGALIVLGGGPANRLTGAVQLWREGLAPLLVLSGGAPGDGNLTQAETMAESARALGVPERDLVLDNHSNSTFQNALDTLPLLVARHVRSALVVSSNYHMLRSRFLFTAVYRTSGIRLRFIGMPWSGFDPERWWATPSSAYTTLSEYAKLAVNVLEVAIWSATRARPGRT